MTVSVDQTCYQRFNQLVNLEGPTLVFSGSKSFDELIWPHVSCSTQACIFQPGPLILMFNRLSDNPGYWLASWFRTGVQDLESNSNWSVSILLTQVLCNFQMSIPTCGRKLPQQNGQLTVWQSSCDFFFPPRSDQETPPTALLHVQFFVQQNVVRLKNALIMPVMEQWHLGLNNTWKTNCKECERLNLIPFIVLPLGLV